MLCAGLLGHAQITTGESSSRVIRTGNRAEEGDFGLYLGGTTTIFKNFDNLENFDFLPLINVKYMFTDQVEGRVGIEWWKEKSTTDDDGDESIRSESSMLFYPGIAYHFSKSNLLDVYVGAELPFGWGAKKIEYDDDESRASFFRLGVGAFIGLQAYVANLPVAIGVEYGLSTLYNGVSDGYLYKDGMSIKEHIDNSKWNLGHQARVTLTYFFKL